MHYLNYALSDTCVFQEINVSKLTKNRLQMKEVIQCCLLFSLPAHPLEMALVLAQSLYEAQVLPLYIQPYCSPQEYDTFLSSP
jgi:hypothetical protein